jgi:hypothetical protein
VNNADNLGMNAAVIPMKISLDNQMKINPNLSVREVDDEIVLFDPDSEYIHALNESAADIFEFISLGFDEFTIGAAICIENKIFNSDQIEMVKESVKNCIDELISKGIVIK